MSPSDVCRSCRSIWRFRSDVSCGAHVPGLQEVVVSNPVLVLSWLNVRHCHRKMSSCRAVRWRRCSDSTSDGAANNEDAVCGKWSASRLGHTCACVHSVECRSCTDISTGFL
ncbi:hypothetical protein DOTSEDRAFT_68897 [Dothistroma septosporum NZE10]|uniref:Uncharacterized protein n=1 Tax=Dothistroma septosporum (strain NZE10 / CBS 128990) TaxID=675120 RepID=N1Q3B9_DOTSN|nr:hypothetical protein DOTSEDRAFT_68897 [Dothistroma septosporum NZE10]